MKCNNCGGRRDCGRSSIVSVVNVMGCMQCWNEWHFRCGWRIEAALRHATVRATNNHSYQDRRRQVVDRAKVGLAVFGVASISFLGPFDLSPYWCRLLLRCSLLRLAAGIVRAEGAGIAMMRGEHLNVASDARIPIKGPIVGGISDRPQQAAIQRRMNPRRDGHSSSKKTAALASIGQHRTAKPSPEATTHKWDRCM